MKRPRLYAWRLPDGRYLGRRACSDPLAPGPPGDSKAYTKKEIDESRVEVLTLFPTASPVPRPKWNPESEEYETPFHFPRSP